MKKIVLLMTALCLAIALSVAPVPAQAATGPAGINTNCGVWYAADDTNSTITAGKVVGWHDLSGNKTELKTKDSLAGPELVANGRAGKPVLRFTGNEVLRYKGTALNTWIYLGDGFHSFVVCKVASANDVGAIWGRCDTGGNSMMYLTNYGTDGGYLNKQMGFYLYGSAQAITGDHGAQDITLDWEILECSFDVTLADTNFKFSANGVDKGGWDHNLHVYDYNTDFTVGGQSYGLDDKGWAFKGDIAELVIYKGTPLSAADRGEVGSYLANKWGITDSTYVPVELSSFSVE